MPMNAAKTPPIRRGFSFSQFKAIDEGAGSFEGYMSVFHAEDSGGDIVEPGAFTKTLAELRAKQIARQTQGVPSGRYILPIFWGHDPNICIGGLLDAVEDAHGVLVRGELDLNVEQARNAYSGLKSGYIPGMSFGYFSIKATYDRVGVRHLREVSVFESTITPIPMQPLALVMDIKNAGNTETATGAPGQTITGGGKGKQMTRNHRRKALDFTTALQVVSADDSLQDDWGDSFQAFVTAMHSVMCQACCTPDMADDDSAPAFDGQAAAETVLEQFSAHMSDLVKQSLASSFVPALDDDGDSFLDPDGPNAGGDSDMGYMSADTSAAAGAEVKSGRVMSAANHKAFGGMLAAMKKSMDELGATHKSLKAFHTQVDPNAKPDTAEGADSAPGSDTTSSGGGAPPGGKALDTTSGETPTGAGAPERATTPLTADEMGHLIRDRMTATRLSRAVESAAR